MRFAEYYHESTGWNGRDFSGPKKLIPACGSDSVLCLDGRLSLRNCIGVATIGQSHRRDYLAFRIMAGRSFSDARPLTNLIHRS